MSDVYISYARSTATQAEAVAAALRSLGYRVWREDEAPADHPYPELSEERLRAAKAVVVIWSAEAVGSQSVQTKADRAREDGKLVQLSLDNTGLPMPFACIPCADLTGWTGDLEALGWRTVAESVADLVGEADPADEPISETGPDPLVLCTVANWLLLAGEDFDAAALLADRAVALSPNSPRVWQASGILRLQSGSPNRAYEHLRKALRLDPQSPDRAVLLGLLALALFGRGQFRQAVSRAKQSARLRPNWPLPHAVLAAAYGHLGEPRAAWQEIERHRTLSPVEIGDWAQSWSPDLGALVMQGIALAEGSGPAGGGAGAQ